MILALPKASAEVWKKFKKPSYECICKNSDTVILHYDNSVKTEEKITVGLVYSGRVEKIFKDWLDKLVSDTKNISTELIIINNSRKKLPSFIDNYKKHFFSFTEIVDNTVINKNSLQQKKIETSKLLAKSYTYILGKSKGNIIHFREDDIIPIDDAFDQLLKTLIDNKKSKPIVSGIYQSRYIVKNGDSNINNIIENVEKFKNDNKDVKIIEAISCPTGMMIFYKSLVPIHIPSNYKTINTHDWAWCEKHRSTGGKVFVVTNAVCKHYIDDENYLIPSGKIRSSAHFIKTEENKISRKKREIIKNPKK